MFNTLKNSIKLIASSRFFYLWVSLILFLFTFLISIRPVADFDIFFQMLIGKETLDNFQIPREEFYIFPALGERAHFSGWAFGVLYHIAYTLNGFKGMSILNALIWGLALFFILKAALIGAKNKIGVLGSIIVSLFALAFVYADFIPRTLMRAESTLFLFWAISIYIYAKLNKKLYELKDVPSFVNYKGLKLNDLKENPWTILILTFPVFAFILSWVHTTAIFMIFFLFAILFNISGKKILNLMNKNKINVVDGWQIIIPCAIICCIIMSLLNPYGLTQGLPHIEALINRISSPDNGSSAGSGSVGMINVEYAKVLDTGQANAFIIYFIVSILVIFINKGRRLFDAMILITMASLAYLHSRNMGLFAFSLIEPLAVSLSIIVALIKEKIILKLLKEKSIYLFLLLIPIFFTLTIFSIYKQSTNSQMGLGAGIKDEMFPVGCIEELNKRYPDGTNVFNFHHLGSYISWASNGKLKSTIDGHFTAPTKAWGVYTDLYFSKKDDLIKKLDRNEIKAAILPSIVPFVAGYVPAAAYLFQSSDWKIINQDKSGLCFVRLNKNESKDSSLNNNLYWQNVKDLSARIFKTASFDADVAYKKAKISYDEAIINLTNFTIN